MSHLQSIAGADAQQTGNSSQSWVGYLAKPNGYLAKWFRLLVGPDVQTGVEEMGPFPTRSVAIAGREYQAGEQILTSTNHETFGAQNMHQRFEAELHRIRADLYQAKQANGNLQMEKAELERENNTLYGSLNQRQESQISDLIEDLQVLEVKNYNLRMKNVDLESQIASMVQELQQVHDENGVLQHLQWHSHYAAEHQRDLYKIRRRIIIEKMTKVLGNRYGQKRRHESFDNWSRRVKYPGWELMTGVATRVIKQGNKVAHRATRTELQAAIDFDPVYVDEEGYPGKAEILQKMLNIVYNEGEIGEDDDDNDDDDNDDDDFNDNELSS